MFPNCVLDSQMVTLLHLHKPTVLNPTVFDSKKMHELLMSVKGRRSITDEFTILCNCKKCSTGRCVFSKPGLPCISFRKYQRIQGDGQTVQCKNPYVSIHG